MHKYTDKYRSLTFFVYLSMLISLVLGYKKEFHRHIFGGAYIKGKNKCKKDMGYTRKGGALFLGSYGILWLYDFAQRLVPW